MAACPDKEAWVSGRLEGTLEGDSARALDAHLVTCAACREEVAANDALLGFVALPPLRAIDERMMAALPERLARAGRPAVRAPRRFPLTVGLALAACAAFAVLAVESTHGTSPRTVAHSVPPRVVASPSVGAVDEEDLLEDLTEQDPEAAALAAQDLESDSAVYDSLAYEDVDTGLENG